MINLVPRVLSLSRGRKREDPGNEVEIVKREQDRNTKKEQALSISFSQSDWFMLIMYVVTFIKSYAVQANVCNRCLRFFLIGLVPKISVSDWLLNKRKLMRAASSTLLSTTAY